MPTWRYGLCPDCGAPLEPETFTEKEYGRNGLPTGRWRIAVACLFCEHCGRRTQVDDSFDGPWHG